LDGDNLFQGSTECIGLDIDSTLGIGATLTLGASLSMLTYRLQCCLG